jgi:hypothetical protein
LPSTGTDRANWRNTASLLLAAFVFLTAATAGINAAQVLTGAPVGVSAGGANAQGTSNALARADHVHACATASGSVSGCLASGDWTTFNTKLGSVTADAPLSGAGSSASHLVCATASGSQAGCVSSTDWTTFNGKLSSVTADAPLSGGGTSASHLVCAAASGSQAGCLSSTDWTAFNGKQAALTFPITVAQGGTNSTATPTGGGIGYGTGTAHAYSAAGTGGQVLYSGGTGAPTWSDGDKVVRLTADYTNATTTLTNTVLTWTSPAAVSRSHFRCSLMVKSSATTLGTQVAVNSSVAPTTITYMLTWISAAGTAPSTGGTQAVVTTVANATALGPAAGLTTYTLWALEGIIVHTSSASTVTVQAKASGVGTVTIGSGSNCQFYSL